MVKYVDSGMGDTTNGKKKVKKGFKEDRRANYEKMLAKKNGKFRGREPPAAAKPVRVKSVAFDQSALKDYVLTLHKRKNERRVQAFVDVKRKMRREHARERRQQREEARLAYNNYARVPILPNYTYKLPRYHVSDDDEDEDEMALDDDEDVMDDQDHADLDEEATRELVQDDTADLPWVFLGDDGEPAEDDSTEIPTGKRGKKQKQMRAAKRLRADTEEGDQEDDVSPEEAARRRRVERKRRLKLVTEASTTHTMPMSMTVPLGSTTAATSPASAAPHAPIGIDDETIMVEVKPLFGSGGTLLGSSGMVIDTTKYKKGDKRAQRPPSSLPSQNFSDLPAVVEEELLRLRKETKGPTRTKPKVHLMKELQKIRKIRKYSRKGHGKKTTSGKRKNRKK